MKMGWNLYAEETGDEMFTDVPQLDKVLRYGDEAESMYKAEWEPYIRELLLFNTGAHMLVWSGSKAYSPDEDKPRVGYVGETRRDKTFTIGEVVTPQQYYKHGKDRVRETYKAYEKKLRDRGFEFPLPDWRDRLRNHQQGVTLTNYVPQLDGFLNRPNTIFTLPAISECTPRRATRQPASPGTSGRRRRRTSRPPTRRRPPALRRRPCRRTWRGAATART